MRFELKIPRILVFSLFLTVLGACTTVAPTPEEVVLPTLNPFPTSVPLTDTPIPTATATLRASATPLPTLTLAPSLTPIPTDTPTPAIFGLGLTSGPFRDDFSDPGSGWVNEGGDQWSIGYYEGGYRIVNNFFKSEVTASRSRSHTDFIIEADVHKLSGANSAYFGVTCRKLGETYYTMGITGNGEYVIVKTFNDEPSVILEGTSPAIKKGDAVNHIKGSCIGKVISITVNDVLLGAISDDGPLFGIFVGINVGTQGDDGIEVKFDNFNSYPTGDAPAFPTITPTGSLQPTATPTKTPTPTP